MSDERKQQAVLAAVSQPAADLGRYTDQERTALEAIYDRTLADGATERIDVLYGEFAAAHAARLEDEKAVIVSSTEGDGRPPRSHSRRQ